METTANSLLLKLRSNDLKIVLSRSYSNIYKVMKSFPPRLNENKFIYGKLIERIIIELLRNTGTCIDLDKKCKIGSSYKNDCYTDGVNYSIKAMKQKSSVILINKLSEKKHNINGMSFIIVNIMQARLYVFTYSEKYEKYVNDTHSIIQFRSSLFTFLDKDKNTYIDFSKNINDLNEIDKSQPVDIYPFLLKTFIL